MQAILNEIGITDLRKFVGFMGTDELSDDFFITKVSNIDDDQMNQADVICHPCRFDGYFTIYCIKGELEVEVNLRTYTLSERSTLVNVPGNVIRLANKDRLKNTEFVIIALSRDFIMSSLKIDFITMFNDSLSMLDEPCFKLDDESFAVCAEYYRLLTMMIEAKSPQLKNAINSLITSILYFLGARWTATIQEAKERGEDSPSQTLRAKMVFDKFIALVTTYHTRERSMGFYADMLALTPKYLSKLIKNVSGKSGPEWIDQYVILEAKNLLKYSSKSIKEVMYALNFQNQSVFYKFFKAHTGMTPSEYRES